MTKVSINTNIPVMKNKGERFPVQITMEAYVCNDCEKIIPQGSRAWSIRRTDKNDEADYVYDHAHRPECTPAAQLINT